MNVVADQPLVVGKFHALAAECGSMGLQLTADFIDSAMKICIAEMQVREENGLPVGGSASVTTIVSLSHARRMRARPGSQSGSLSGGATIVSIRP